MLSQTVSSTTFQRKLHKICNHWTTVCIVNLAYLQSSWYLSSQALLYLAEKPLTVSLSRRRPRQEAHSVSSRLLISSPAIVVFQTSNTMCLDELMKSSLQSTEDDADKYYKIKDVLEEKERSLNFEEMKDWGSKNILKMNPSTINKMPNSAANLPLRFGRGYPEERSIKPIANLPLRFGRAFGDNIPRHAPEVSHRPGRSPLVKSSSQSLLNFPQRFGKSLSVNLPQEVQESEPGI
ncbi:pro-FMRFamide-related neuropeptide VF [Pezoporus occidentalis]|uniref:pro-FMRFamide-related neuropeptide VF n=1 Tax=Pezoporus occidentalis TaxID=407982 RepID=UPI002F9071EC